MATTEHGWLRQADMAGQQPRGRYPGTRSGSGALKFHAYGCVVDGGAGLEEGICRKCVEQIDVRFLRALMFADRPARGGGR